MLLLTALAVQLEKGDLQRGISERELVGVGDVAYDGTRLEGNSAFCLVEVASAGGVVAKENAAICLHPRWQGDVEEGAEVSGVVVFVAAEDRCEMGEPTAEGVGVLGVGYYEGNPCSVTVTTQLRCLSLRAGNKRDLSDEERQALSDRMKQITANRQAAYAAATDASDQKDQK